MLIVANGQISRIKSCAKEEVASFLRPGGINAYVNGFDECLQEDSCWDGQLQNKTSEFCLDTEMLLHLMTVSGISKTTETVETVEQATGPEISKQNKFKQALKEWHSFSSIRSRVKNGVLRGSRNGNAQDAQIRNIRYISVSPALDYQYPLEQSALSCCSTPASDRTVVHDEMFASCVVKSNSTTNILRLREVIE